jgi:hypothetical protein
MFLLPVFAIGVAPSLEYYLLSFRSKVYSSIGVGAGYVMSVRLTALADTHSNEPLFRYYTRTWITVVHDCGETLIWTLLELRIIWIAWTLVSCVHRRCRDVVQNSKCLAL